jgi:hypothetical protein
VCNAIINNELISEIIIANSNDEASSLFKDKFNCNPKNILGPFLKKKVPPVEVNTAIKFSGLPKQAIYNDWLVNAFLLKDPENYAFLIYLKNTNSDNKKSLPKGTTIVPITDIRFI